MRKKLLIVSYYWPPAGGPGVQRWVKMSKYLARMGYECHVVTVDENKASYPSIDGSLEKEIETSVKVTKTGSFEILKIFTSLFRKEKAPYAGIPDKDKMSKTGRMALYIRSNYFIPDARIGWNKYALEACKKIIIEEKIDVVITTSPPHSTQLTGLRLKKLFPHIKWIADMRDPWTDIYYYDKLSHTEASKKKDLILELAVLEKADKITTVSEDIKKIFADKSNVVNSENIVVIPNGFDEEDFKEILVKKNEVFRVVHTGTINNNYNLSGFLQAAKRIQNEGKKLIFRFVGNTEPATRNLIVEQIGDRAEFIGYMEHTEAIREMRQADLLLLAIPDNKKNKGILTGKLFEYLATGKPILGLGPVDGDASAIIEECKAGKMFAYRDSGNMYSYIEEIYGQWMKTGGTSLKEHLYKKYARNELAKKYSDILS